MSSIYKKTKSGYCRICGNYRKLSEDHIPPEKCFNEATIFVNKPYNTTIDKGLRIKSICEKCNNSILGGNYDNELKLLVHEIDKYYLLRYQKNVLFKKVSITISKERIVKSILGHVLSCYGTQEDLSKSFNKEIDCYSNRMRKYVLGEENGFEKEIKIVFWLHPYRTIKVIPYFIFTELLNSETSIQGSLFSFYPIGIWIINKNNYRLLSILNEKVNEIIIDKSDDLKVDMDLIKDEDFPFSILKNKKSIAILYNDKSIIHGLKSEYYKRTQILRYGTY